MRKQEEEEEKKRKSEEVRGRGRMRRGRGPGWPEVRGLGVMVMDGDGFEHAYDTASVAQNSPCMSASPSPTVLTAVRCPATPMKGDGWWVAGVSSRRQSGVDRMRM